MGDTVTPLLILLSQGARVPAVVGIRNLRRANDEHLATTAEETSKNNLRIILNYYDETLTTSPIHFLAHYQNI